MIFNLFCIKPKRIHVIDNVYYFYWRWDVYKPFDYEPVMIYGNNKKIIISRFHWKLATVWFNPILLDDKPNIAFIKGVHTPIIQTQNYAHFLVMDSDNTSDRKLIEIVGSCTGFKNFFLQSPNDMFTKRVDCDDIVYSDDPIDEKYLMRLKDFKGLLIVGPFDPQSLPKEFQDILNYSTEMTR